MESAQTIQKTILHAKHEALGAKMVDFAGFDMPVLYTNLLEEHHTVRNAVGMFDVSHMGEFYINGPQAYDLLEWVTSNDVSQLTNGKVQYTCLPNANGGIVDDALLYKITDTSYLLVVNASNIAKDWDWIQSQNKWDCKLTNASNELSLIAVQGPKATELLQTLTSVNLTNIPYYSFEIGTFNGIENVVISNTGYTGSGGFELYLPNKNAETVWDTILEKGAAYNIKPCGLGARDTLRLEKGYCLYGHDINDTTSPIEAGLGWITKFDKPFVNWEKHLEIKENKPTKKLVGFELIDRGIPRQYYPICNAEGNTIGEVTSGTMSPSLNKAIGMGYVTTPFAKIGTEIYILIRDKQIKASVCKIPFLT